jgi:hypothetical protein
VIHKGNNVEVITDVLPDEVLSAEALLRYRRSSVHKLVVSNKNYQPYMSLKDVEPRPLWDFPGHQAIKNEWFSKLLIFDGGQHDLIVESDAVEYASSAHAKGELVKIIGGEFVIPAKTKVTVAEVGFVWSLNPDQLISELLAEWKFVVDLKLRKVIEDAEVHQPDA